MYWEGKRLGRKMPARRDLDPLLEVPRMTPWIVLTDVLHDPLDFRFRLIGSGVVDKSRANHTGKLFSEMPAFGPGNHLWTSHAEVAKTATPLRSEPPYVGRMRNVRGVADIHLPLSDDDVTVNMIFSVVVFDSV
jgi:hypothetical protein